MIVAMLTQSICAQTFNDETITYKVMYKWGLINKQAGDAALSIKTVGNNYETQLVAKSAPWADQFYVVRDTLNGRIQKDGFLPLFYEKIAHEGKDFKHDVVNYSRNEDTVIGYCTRISQKEGKKNATKKEKSIEEITLEKFSFNELKKAIEELPEIQKQRIMNNIKTHYIKCVF